MLGEFLRATPVLWLLVKRDFRSRYAGSTLGVLWNAIHPLVLIGIYILIFSHLMRDRAGGGSRLDYAVHLTAGMIPWFLFTEVVSRGTTALVDNASFLKKMAMPEEVLHAGIFINALITHTIGLAGLAVLLMLMGVPIGPKAVLAIPVMVALGLTALGLSMFLSVLHLVMRDIGQLVNIGLQFAFWLTPIVYYTAILPESLQSLPRLNPLTAFISAVQRLLGSPGHEFAASSYHLMALLPFVSLLLGLSFLRKHRAEVLDLL